MFNLISCWTFCRLFQCGLWLGECGFCKIQLMVYYSENIVYFEVSIGWELFFYHTNLRFSVNTLVNDNDANL